MATLSPRIASELKKRQNSEPLFIVRVGYKDFYYTCLDCAIDFAINAFSNSDESVEILFETLDDSDETNDISAQTENTEDKGDDHEI